MHFIIGLKVSRIFQTSYGSRQKKAYNAFERSETSLTARINFVFLLLIWHWACQWCIEFAKCTRNELTFSASNIWSGNQIVCLCQEEFDYNAIIISFCKLVMFYDIDMQMLLKHVNCLLHTFECTVNMGSLSRHDVH